MTRIPSNITSRNAADALAAYLALAYPGEGPLHHTPPAIDANATLNTTLASFMNESTRAAGGGRARYALRLGNARYPHMKLVIEEAMNSDLFFFAVDTHDQASVTAAALGTEQWHALQEYNSILKRKIQAAWLKAGLPTLETMKRMTHMETQKVRSGGARVLIVDDEEDAAQLCAILLARAGYNVDAVCEGEAAIERARKTLPDLVLLDYMMPQLSGREVCFRLKSDEHTRNIPVLIATYADVDAQSVGLADDVLKKPYDLSALVERVNRLLENKAEKS